MVTPNKSDPLGERDPHPRLISRLLRDTDSPVLLTLQGILVLAVGVYIVLKGYYENDCSWPIEREPK